jgi:hypothetical protein
VDDETKRNENLFLFNFMKLATLRESFAGKTNTVAEDSIKGQRFNKLL